MSRYDQKLFEYIDIAIRSPKLSPMNLGGISGSGGGAGGPPGGFVGMLPQTKVSYDTTEAELLGFINPGAVDASGVVVSGSLLDNLNHIRYRIAQIEDSGVSANLIIRDDGVVVASGVTILDFYDNLDVTDLGGGAVRIDATASGGSGTDEKVKVTSNDTTADYLKNKLVAGTDITIVENNDGGNETLTINSTATVSGGGGAPTDAYYVTVSGHAQLSNEVIITGLKGHADIESHFGGGISLEFNDNTDPFTWDTNPDVAFNSNQTRPGHYYVETSSSFTSAVGYTSWNPGSGAFDARAKISFASLVDTTSPAFALHIGDSGNSNRLRCGLEIAGGSVAAYRARAYTYTGGSYTARGFTWTVTGKNELYFRITRDGSNNISFYWSADGWAWQRIATQAFTLTVANIGLYVASNNASGFADWIRTNV